MSDLGEILQALLADMRALRREIDGETTTNVSRAALRGRAAEIATRWRDDAMPLLSGHSGFDEGLLHGYDEQFTRLLELSLGPNRRSTYLTLLRKLDRRFRSDLVVPAFTRQVSSASTPWDEFLDNLPSGVESEYFAEAISCARDDYLRAAAVMGWCAAVDHVQRKVALVGFTQFNNASVRAAGQDKGRFKRFRKKFDVHSLSELRATVFDEDLLTVVEAMELIENNQYRRLRACLELRHQAAHPGEASITTYNLMSFFSDIVEIVLRNPMFELKHGEESTDSA